MTNTIKRLREKRGLTQSQLAEESKLSLRTIQRVEASNELPKGHTLKSLEDYFDIKIRQADLSQDEKSLSKIKLINFSILLCVFLPMLHIVIPLTIWKRHRENPTINKLSKPILNFQLQWIFVYVLLIVISSFIQGKYNLNPPLVIVVMLVLVIFNLLVVFLTAQSLSQKGELPAIVLRPIQLL